MATTKCIWCNEEIEEGARICKHCDREQNEKLKDKDIFDGGPHLMSFVGTFTLDAVLCLLMIGIPMIIGNYLLYGVLALVITGIPLFLYHYFYYSNINYQITSKTIQIEKGIFSKSISDLDLFRIEDVSLGKSPADMILGTGSITIISGDESDPELTLSGIPGAKDVFDELTDAIEARRAEVGVSVQEEMK